MCTIYMVLTSRKFRILLFIRCFALLRTKELQSNGRLSKLKIQELLSLQSSVIMRHKLLFKMDKIKLEILLFS